MQLHWRKGICRTRAIAMPSRFASIVVASIVLMSLLMYAHFARAHLETH